MPIWRRLLVVVSVLITLAAGCLALLLQLGGHRGPLGLVA